MSMLGFDAVGRSALGQLPRIGPTNTVLLASMAAYTATRISAYFNFKQTVVVAPFSSASFIAAMRVTFASLPGSSTLIGNVAALSTQFSTNAGNFGLTGIVARSATQLPCLGVPCTVAGLATSFSVSLLPMASSFVLAGYSTNVIRDHEAWFPLPLNGGAWDPESVETSTWTESGTALGAWTAYLAQTKTWTPANVQPETWIAE